MKNSLVASFFYFLLCIFFILGSFLPIRSILLCFFYFIYSYFIRHFYKQKQKVDIELKDFVFAFFFCILILFLHLWTFEKIDIEQSIILFCITCIASVNYGCLLRYEILL